MASESAKAVAREVSKAIRNESPVNLGKIIRSKGYSKETSLKPKLVTSTKSYQEELKPVLDQLEKERQRLLIAISKKDLDQVRYEDATRSLDILTKNIQLLSGGNTEKSEVKVIGIEYITPNENNFTPHS